MSPFFYAEYVYKWLDSALEYGISEQDFWNMTLAELRRLIDSKKRIHKIEMQEKATLDYILADTIGRSISRIYNSANKIPDINELYPTLFDSKEIEKNKAEQRKEISALRFMQFAQSFNSKYKEVAKNE